ncbi:uncharacterized protein LOC118170768 [Oxyura jamaicensis]|uniref:uncharacterized protein LOC118170768 n=1 Tax=Oxyura jamaicensis TaxID=8884 RepID=UPI0015A5731D|nr:uncharacterized protein LOC118170768 [Oxyura jamaicensis]
MSVLSLLLMYCLKRDSSTSQSLKALTDLVVNPHHRTPESRQEPGFQHLPGCANCFFSGPRRCASFGSRARGGTQGSSRAACGGSEERAGDATNTGGRLRPRDPRPPAGHIPCAAAPRGGAGAADRCGPAGGRAAGRGRPGLCVDSRAALPPVRRRWRRRQWEPRPRDKREGAGRCALRRHRQGGREGTGEGAGGLCREERRRPPACPSVRPSVFLSLSVRPPGGIPGGPPSPSRREAAAHRGGAAAAAAASSCGTGRRCQEPGERRWQCRSQEQKLAEIMFCIQENEESVLMTKHRNLENHRIPGKPWRMEQTQRWSLKSSWNLCMGSYPDFGQLICGDWSAHQDGTSACSLFVPKRYDDDQMLLSHNLGKSQRTMQPVHVRSFRDVQGRNACAHAGC